ncbi:MAG: phosphate ABC transporter permease PstA [Deltaproteobacteria bacterium]|jgi:phosphate transport system permease protein|nr:phosphate ABC transporter permease PstA [SAR324 cluster bacterium]MEC8183446.1 phosphate ABC transporter permease PstA [SAR324 cluster bacterium]MEC8843931.1 phosphate ABC transporter permease PstA [SAR324 cluster bacterium]|tara:strand:- start:3572 stop:4855 length:1284 start_codon:yes stop_codon:yes gene_type:complete
MSESNPMAGSNSSFLKGRYSAEKRFKLYGVFAVSLALGAVIFLLFTIFSTGYSAFWRTEFQVEIQFNGDYLGITQESSDQEVREANFLGLFRKNLAEQNNDVPRRELRKLFAMFSESAADDLREMVITNRSILGTTQKLKVLASSSVDMIVKGQAPREIEEKRRVLNDFQLGLLDRWTAEGRRSSSFNHRFFTNGDSRSPELAGLGGAIAGSFWTLMVCLILSFPMGVAAAIYLEEYAPKNRLTEIIEVNINNLAAVPSIIFGLLGLAVILNFFGLPRSTPLVGGIVLSLMTLPTIIIACRASLKAVPPSIREGALAMGASKMQTILHHVLPLAMPGTLTGTIIGLAQALGETAPLLMIGMFAFVVDIPAGPLESATALPVQVYLWAESSERGYVELTAAGIMMILIFMALMNSFAIILRKKFERRW